MRAAPAIWRPSCTTVDSTLGRSAYCVHSVTTPDSRTDKKEISLRVGQRKLELLDPARQGQPGALTGQPQAASVLAATAAAATGKVWVQRSGSSLPQLAFTKSSRAMRSH